jgi:hypothetical protein
MGVNSAISRHSAYETDCGSLWNALAPLHQLHRCEETDLAMTVRTLALRPIKWNELQRGH